MKNTNFKRWILNERKDIFGFEKETDPNYDISIKDDPIIGTNIEEITENLSKYDIDNKKGKIIASNEVVWGEGAGSLKVVIKPLLYVEIKQLNQDLKGTDVWITKKLFVLNREGAGSKEEEIIHTLLEELEDVSKKPLQKITKNRIDIKRLSEKVYYNIQKVCRSYFYFEGIKEVDENNFIVRFGVGGQGVLARDHNRVIENQTLVNFDENTGLIRITNYNIITKTTGHYWNIRPMDSNFYFLPNQSEEEIMSAIRMTMKWY